MALPRILKNINLFADGRNYMGKVTEMTLPKLTSKTEEYRGGGMGGPIEYTMGYEKLKASFTLAEIDKHLLKLTGLQAQHAVNVQMRGVIDDEQGNIGSIVATLRGKLTEADLGTMKPGEKSETKFTMAVNFYELKVNDEIVHYIDVINNVYTIGGVDQMIAHRTILDGGLSGTARALVSALAQFAASKIG
jgi:P2 family phage contractile tail tube protein